VNLHFSTQRGGRGARHYETFIRGKEGEGLGYCSILLSREQSEHQDIGFRRGRWGDFLALFQKRGGIRSAVSYSKILWNRRES